MLSFSLKAALFGAAIVATSVSLASAAPASISSQPFGELPDGQKVTLYTLTNTRGSSAQIMDYGGIIQSLRVPDKRGWMGDVVLGYPTLAEYVKDNPYFGALVGRYANRIAKGRFTLDGKTYQLATNNGPNHLHGGKVGFDKKVWKAHPLRTQNGPALELHYFSPVGDQSYPGNLNVRVLYTLTNSNQLRVDYRAVTDAPTIVNLTQHSYFNLAGNGTILNHKLRLYADKYTPIDPTSIPLGELQSVAGTPFDFRRSTAIGARIGDDNGQLKNGQGYDHNFVLNHARGTLGLAARVDEPTTGRVMRVYTTQPGVQLYSGNFLSGQKGKYGRQYARRDGFCLETQHYPDSPNQPNFPSTTLRPGQTYRQTTIYEFSTR